MSLCKRMLRRLGAAFVTIVASGAVLWGCGGGSLGAAGDFGATPGGVQDLNVARETVRAGRVPAPEALLVEAAFSEHDLPLAGDPCTTTLCLRTALGAAPDAAQVERGWLQVGLSSTIDPEAYVLPPTTFIATVDISGSMGWGYGSETPGAIARLLLRRVARELRQQDRMAIVVYGMSAAVVLQATPGGSDAIDATIEALHEDGSTNMEEGLRLAYQLAGNLAGNRRVLLFTDVQPNVGAIDGGTFRELVGDAGDDGIGTTVFAVGLGVGTELLRLMADLRGGNAFGVMAGQDVEGLMNDSWPWLASPIAYDLEVTVRSNERLTARDAYGFPGYDSGANVRLAVASVFLSRRRGALLVELAAGEDSLRPGDGVTTTLRYEDAGGQAYELDLPASFDGAARDSRGVSMPQQGLDKTVALALLVDGMHEAAELYGTNPQDAIDRLSAALDRFASDAAAIDDEGLSAEAAFWPRLLTLMQQGASQESFYGGF